MNIEGKTVLIVGAGRGIGRRVAELFSEADVNLVISSRSENELAELEYKLNTNGNQNVLALAAEAGVEADVKALVDESIKKFGLIDYLVHAAGMGILKPLGDVTPADFDNLLKANV